MKYLFILPLVFSLFAGQQPESDICKTSFVVNDCDGKPIPGVTVSITICSTKKDAATTTNSKGIATFPVCKSDICKSRITFIGYQGNTKNGLIGDCSGSDSNTTCKINLCDRK